MVFGLEQHGTTSCKGWENTTRTPARLKITREGLQALAQKVLPQMEYHRF